MFKAPFSFDGRIRRIEYFLSGIIGGIVFGVAYSLGLATLFLGAAAGSAGGSLFGILIGIVAGIASIWFSLGLCFSCDLIIKKAPACVTRAFYGIITDKL